MMLKLKIHQFTYSLDIETGNVIANQNKEDKPVTDLPTKLRVYAAYAKVEKLDSVYFNGHSYAKVFGYIVNINTGKAVVNPDIASKFKR
jgi:hypothetical protein